MIDAANHYLIVRYLKSPIIDFGGGDIVSPKAVKMTGLHMPCIKDRSVNTVCLDGIRDDGDKHIGPLWNMLADGGCLVSSNPLPDEALKELRRIGRYQVIERNPIQVIKKLSGTGGEIPYAKPTPAPGQKTVCLVRYGALGDHIQMSPVIEHYHREGWYVVYNTNRKGRDVYKGDPRINEYIDHEDDIIRPTREELDDYWNRWAKHFDQHTNFNGIAEEGLLRIEGKQGEWNDPWEKRHADCNKNYFDEHFVRAGLPEIKGRLPVVWLSDKEKEWAKGEVEEAKRKTGKSFIVLWNIMGSSFHKMYPWAYDVWYLCQHNGDDIGFITVSDAMGTFLEEKRFKNILPRAGKYSIRHTLALHSAVDGVVTMETNSMNAGLAFPAPVITLLSHSGKEQFPWREQDITLVPPHKDCKCHPCHQLHYSRIGCPRGIYNKDATLCMDSIAPIEVYNALLRIRNGDIVSNAS